MQYMLSSWTISLEEAWVPSKDWCYWFMHKQMGLTVRRVAGHKDTPLPRGVVEAQDRLHKVNLQYLALRIADSLDPKYISGSDELGSFLFPQAK